MPGGHRAVCGCGWHSTTYTVPDTAWKAGVAHDEKHHGGAA